MDSGEQFNKLLDRMEATQDLKSAFHKLIEERDAFKELVIEIYETDFCRTEAWMTKASKLLGDEG